MYIHTCITQTLQALRMVGVCTGICNSLNCLNQTPHRNILNPTCCHCRPLNINL